MEPGNEKPEHLFSYGTLQTEEVQLSTFGRLLQGHSDQLMGYKLELVPNQDQTFATPDDNSDLRHVRFTGVPTDIVDGTVFNVSLAELEHADAYEPADYKRSLTRTKSGCNVWVYASTRT